MARARIARSEDAREVGRVLTAGFREDPVMCWVFSEPDRERKIAAMFAFLAREVLVPLGATYIVPGSCAGWTPPGTPDWPSERNLLFGEVMGAVATSADLERLGIFGSATRERHPADAHWYLSVIATDDEARGQGLGSGLLRESLRVVDAARLPAYLESTNPRNVPLYVRHGFEVVDHLHLPDGPVVTLMWREPDPTAVHPMVSTRPDDT